MGSEMCIRDRLEQDLAYAKVPGERLDEIAQEWNTNNKFTIDLASLNKGNVKDDAETSYHCFTDGSRMDERTGLAGSSRTKTKLSVATVTSETTQQSSKQR